jgi:hypothetical protein
MIIDRLSQTSHAARNSGAKTADSKVHISLPPARVIQTVIGALAVRDTITRLTGETIVLRLSILANHEIYRAPVETWIG